MLRLVCGVLWLRLGHCMMLRLVCGVLWLQLRYWACFLWNRNLMQSTTIWIPVRLWQKVTPCFTKVPTSYRVHNVTIVSRRVEPLRAPYLIPCDFFACGALWKAEWSSNVPRTAVDPNEILKMWYFQFYQQNLSVFALCNACLVTGERHLLSVI